MAKTGPSDPSRDQTRINVKAFEQIDEAANVQDYIRILDVFDSLDGIQRLKKAAIDRCRIRPGLSVLDNGCGIGLETIRLARLVAPSGKVTGLDYSLKFLDEARRRASRLELPATYQQGDAQQLPFSSRTFDVSRSERLFPYLIDPKQALTELIRVTKPGGFVSLIEPDFETVTINLSDRGLVRKVLHFDCDHHTKNGWIGRELPRLFKSCGLIDVAVEADVVVFEPAGFSPYFVEIGRAAAQNQVITAQELTGWEEEIRQLLAANELFATISYFMVAGKVREG
ncbi:Methyltransferase type 11 [Nitrospira japonica]|uniref:Methyltransferase type 11 n=1 Tax=Nitrospira japonica TaxID=1325564 RepID=A0A1W1I894_9BACT|nr:methyltransferase domain-containing protein [Nitrospira japonica]SLM49220.1 Methyltransferase type 11 [Nitrospira japonica]